MIKQKRPTKATMRAQLHLHRRRIGWFLVLVIGLFIIQIGYNIRSGQPQILGYATRITTQGLLDSTNSARHNNDSAPLTLNQQLNKAAQTKANDMVQKNYWSHISPDGTQPWAFFDLYKYKYQAAGENLAYGFATSDEVVNAWMNSDAHRANVLGNYKEIGFGIASGSNYQNGKNTVVVAFYGLPSTANQTTGTTSLATGNLNAPTIHVNGLSVITSGEATWATYASLGLILTTAIGFVVTHLELVRVEWYKGKHFLKLHPVFDAVVVIGLAVIMAYTAGGFIR